MLLSPVFMLTALAAAPHISEAQLVQLQQISSESAMLVRFNSPDLARKAAIGLHHALLAGRWQESVLILQLDGAAQAQLAPYTQSIVPAYVWQQQQALAPQLSAADSATIPGYACYASVEETQRQAEQLVRDYPDYASWQKIGSGWAKTHHGSGDDLYVLKLSQRNAGPANKAKLLINSAIHAREYATAALTLAFAKDLLSKTGKDADVDWMLQHHEVHLVLQSNPEGRRIAETGVLWRKNLNNSSCDGSTYGVDLNRNFSFAWFSIPDGSSGNSCDLTYRGVAAGSEPEVQALQAYARTLFPDQRGPSRTDAAPATTPGLHMDIHSFSELVLWPWGDTETAAPNGAALQALGHKLAWFNHYLPTQAIGLYPTDGTSDGVSYGELGIAAITMEIGTAFFESCASYQAKVLPDNLKALYYGLRVSGAPYLLPAGPDITQLQLNGQNTVVPRNVPLRISATVTDAQSSVFGGGVASQPIHQVRLWLDQWPEEAGAVATEVTAADGVYDAVQENISHTLDVTGLTEGRHILYLRATDNSGMQGPVYAQYFTVAAASIPVLPQLELHSQCQALTCTLTATASSANGNVGPVQWNLNNQTLSGSPVSVTFAAAGTYPVVATVTDNLGQQVQKTLSLSVTAPVVAPVQTDRSSGGAAGVSGLLILLLLRRRAPI